MKVKARTRGDKERKGMCLANTKERRIAEGMLEQWLRNKKKKISFSNWLIYNCGFPKVAVDGQSH